MQALVADTAPVPLIKMAMRLLGLGFVVDSIPLLGTIVFFMRSQFGFCGLSLRFTPSIRQTALKAAVLLFGAPQAAASTLLMGVVEALGQKALMAALSGVTVLVLGSPVVVGTVAGFAARALFFVVRGAAGLVYLTVDLTARGIVMAGSALVDALPSSSPPPAYWHIQDNYKPLHRASHHPPIGKSLKDAAPIIIDDQEVAKLAGGADLNTSLVRCTDDEIAVLLGQSKVATDQKPVSSATSIASPSKSPATLPGKANNIAASSPVDLHASSADPDFPGYPIATVSQDAFAGFLSQSVRQIQARQEAHHGKAPSEEEVEEMILADPAWVAPKDAPAGYSARKLEQSVDLHASRLRQRDPIVDSWMDVSAPMMGE